MKATLLVFLVMCVFSSLGSRLGGDSTQAQLDRLAHRYDFCSLSLSLSNYARKQRNVKRTQIKPFGSGESTLA